MLKLSETDGLSDIDNEGLNEGEAEIT